MPEITHKELWQVDVSGQIYEASFDELLQWIDEGALLGTDKVRRGNLRWAEAGRVPSLMPHFSSKASRKSTAVSPSGSVLASAVSANLVYDAALTPLDSNIEKVLNSSKNNCGIHGTTGAIYVCQDCKNAFCKECPRTYGGVKICPACGGMCKLIDEMRRQNEDQSRYRSAVSSGFGLSDLSAAFVHPFKFKSSLFFGALMFMFFTIGQSASAIGGFVMISASLMCFMLANMLTFGVLANTVDNFSQGKTETNFMPDFEDFSMWDDVIHPFFLSIGVYVSSFGVFILALLIGLYFVMSSLSAQAIEMKATIQKTPGSYTYDTTRAIEQSGHVQRILSDTEKKTAERLRQQNELAEGASIPTGDTEAQVMQTQQVIDQQERAQLEALAGKRPDDSRMAKIFAGFTSLAAPLVVIAFIGLLWGLFYFPAACAVAGYTRSFWTTLNPLVGLDTIRRMGFDYVKLLFMGLCILFAAAVVGFILGIVLAPLEIPTFGNLPATAISSLFSFYFSVVFSCVLGYALFKASARLNLYR